MVYIFTAVGIVIEMFVFNLIPVVMFRTDLKSGGIVVSTNIIFELWKDGKNIVQLWSSEGIERSWNRSDPL